LAQISQVPFLGRIPLDPRIGQCSEKGESCLKTLKDSPASEAVNNIVQKIVQIVSDN